MKYLSYYSVIVLIGYKNGLLASQFLGVDYRVKLFNIYIYIYIFEWRLSARRSTGLGVRSLGGVRRGRLRLLFKISNSCQHHYQNNLSKDPKIISTSLS